MIDRCKAVAGGWPPLSGPAGELQSELTKLKSETPRTGDFKEGLTELANLKADFEQLEKDVLSQVPAQDGGEPIDLAELDKARTEGAARVRNARSEVEPRE